jgi:hypothetical protein
VLIGATAALAFNSPGKPPGTGPQNIVWTGQGASSVSPNGTGACAASQEPNGQPANTPYLYWVLTPDGGSLTVNSSTPVLHLGGSGSGNYVNLGLDSPTSNAVKFVTPFFDLGTLTANADMNILTTGTGAWGFKISHGCAPPGAPPAAEPLTVTKDAAGAYTTTYGWTVKKLVDNQSSEQLKLAPGQQQTVNYTVTVTADQGTNSAVIVSGHVTINNPNSGTVNSPPTVTDSLSDGTLCNVDPLPASLPQGATTVGYTCTPDSNFDFGNPPTNKAVINWTGQTLSDGSQLGAGQADTGDVQITLHQSLVDNCVTPSDPQAPPGTFSQVCANNSPQTFTYSVTYTGGTDQNSANPPGTCTDNKNTVVINANDQNNTQVGQDSADVNVCVGADLQVSKDATPAFTRTYTWHINKVVVGPSEQHTSGPATFNYEVSIGHDQGTDSGWQVTGTIHVHNPNNWEDISLTNLADAISNGGTCEVDGSPGLSIPANTTVDYQYTCTYQNPPTGPAFKNVATASWNASAAATTDGSANGEADGAFGAPTTVKGDKVTLTDSLLPGGPGNLGHFDVATMTNNPTTIDYPLTFPNDPAGTCTEHTNVASFADNNNGSDSSSATVTVCVGADLTVNKTASPSFVRTYKWGIAKSVDHQAIDNSGPATFKYTVTVTHDNGTDSNWLVTGDITVKNPNDFESVTANVTDAIDNGGICNIPGGSSVTIAPSSSADLPYVCTYTQAPQPLLGHNTATATWDATAAATSDGSASKEVDADFGSVSPAIVDGSVTVTDSNPGAPNNGNLGTVKYTDPSPFTFGPYPITFSNDPGGTCTPHHNVATFTTVDTGTTGSSTADVLHCIGLDLNVSKTATPSFDRHYLWNIAKAADRTTVTPGGTVNYTITVTQTGVKDGNWQVAGNITVSNPNDWEGIALTGLTDAVNNGGTCTVGGTPAGTLLQPKGTPGDSATFPYTCTYASAPSNPNGHNTATASWTGGFTPDTSAQGGADFAFGNTPANVFDKTVSVSDPMAPSNPLGSVTATDPPAAPAVGVFHYSKKLAEPPSGCVTVNNTATFTGSNGLTGSSTASVKSCSLNALTMGFWHNQNGQKIITASSKVGGWLYNTFGGANGPFANMPGKGSATGAQVAAYFITVFNAANSAGNGAAMLEAQFFATALNVYFSDGSLGGNQIGASAPIGSALIDIHAYSAAFGGATQMTVLQMLSYAAGQSNAGGTSWYSGDKTKTTTASSAFNDINNDLVTGP